MKIEIIRPGLQTTLQDLGRTGSRQYGVSTCGALDPIAARTANLLVGNVESSAVLETAYAGLRFRFTDERVVAWCGAPFEVELGGQPLPPGQAGTAAEGDELVVRGAPAGFRIWIAISGGIDVPPVLGSRSTDLRAGFGGYRGRALREGDHVPLGAESGETGQLRRIISSKSARPWRAAASLAVAQTGTEAVLRVIRGRDWLRFGSTAHHAFFRDAFEVSSESDRMGVRLGGVALDPGSNRGELVSEGVVPGTIQVPAGGRPIILLADCQTIGGYPKIAHVTTADLPRAAQLRPGDSVRFQEISMQTAHQALFDRERALARLRIGITLRG